MLAAILAFSTLRFLQNYRRYTVVFYSSDILSSYETFWQKMGNLQNRKRKKEENSAIKGSQEIQRWRTIFFAKPFEVKLRDFTAKLDENHRQSDYVKEGTIFINAEVLFGVFGDALVNK